MPTLRPTRGAERRVGEEEVLRQTYKSADVEPYSPQIISPVYQSLDTRTLPSPTNRLTMFSRVAVFATLALPLLAVATPVELEARQTCSTGAIQCCNSVQSVSAPTQASKADTYPCATSPAPRRATSSLASSASSSGT